MAGSRNEHENELLEHLRTCIPQDVPATILADRGFCDQQPYAHMATLRFDFLIHFGPGILLTDEHGNQKAASEWLPTSGRATRYTDMAVTADCFVLPAVVLLRDKPMLEA